MLDIQIVFIFFVELGFPSSIPLQSSTSAFDKTGCVVVRDNLHPHFNDSRSYVHCFYGARPEKGNKKPDPVLEKSKMDRLALMITSTALQIIPEEGNPHVSFFGKQTTSGVYVPYPTEEISMELCNSRFQPSEVSTFNGCQTRKFSFFPCFTIFIDCFQYSSNNCRIHVELNWELV